MEEEIREEVLEEKKEKKGFFRRLVSGLAKTRSNIVSSMDSIFSGFSKIDDDFYEEIEEILIMGDIGVETTEKIIGELKDKVKENKIKDPKECKQILIDTIKNQMDIGTNAYDFENQKLAADADYQGILDMYQELQKEYERLRNERDIYSQSDDALAEIVKILIEKGLVNKNDLTPQTAIKESGTAHRMGDSLEGGKNVGV